MVVTAVGDPVMEDSPVCAGVVTGIVVGSGVAGADVTGVVAGGIVSVGGSGVGEEEGAGVAGAVVITGEVPTTGWVWVPVTVTAGVVVIESCAEGETVGTIVVFCVLSGPMSAALDGLLSVTEFGKELSVPRSAIAHTVTRKSRIKISAAYLCQWDFIQTALYTLSVYSIIVNY